MPRTAPSLLLVPAVAALLLGSGCATTVEGTAAAQVAGTKDPVSWTNQVCGSLLPFIRTAAASPDPKKARSKDELVQNLSVYLGQSENAAGTARTDLQAAGSSPVAGGDEVVATIDGSLLTLQTTFGDARARVDNVDVNNQKELLDVVPKAVESVEQLKGLPNPTRDMRTSPELMTAAEQAPNCRQIDGELGQ